MSCFYYFKDKSRKWRRKSAPELEEQEKSTFTRIERVTKSSGSSASPRGIPELYEERAHNLRVFSYGELRHATYDFSRLCKIGEGGFGSVYKGSIKPVNGNGDPILVAIKKLNQNGLQECGMSFTYYEPNCQKTRNVTAYFIFVRMGPAPRVREEDGHKQWLAEVQFLGVVQHQNLVKLIGYCAVDGERGIQRLLVYEYMSNKSLESHLFNKAYDPLPWKTRLEIALGAAQGLAYLHEDSEVQVIYRDFKCSNVLLDENFRPKLSDFGLAREGPVAGNTHVSTAVMGTYGYAAPDYIETGHLTAKSDVWSFGVVLYEILTGRRSMERNRPKSEQKLLEWVKQYPPDTKRFLLIMDPRLEGQYLINGARKLARLADNCLCKSAKDRPTMSQVVEILKQIILASDDEESAEENIDISEDDPAEPEEKPNQKAPTELWKKRMAHLAKLGEHVESASRRRFMILQRANVP